MVLSTGSPIDALLASAAIPGVFPAVQIAGRRLVDGGIAADLPVLQAEELGATTSYVLPRAVTVGLGTHPHGVVRALVRTTNQLLARSSDRDVAAARHDVRVMPAPVSATTPFDFRDSRRLIHDGYAPARSWLDGETSSRASATSIPLHRVGQRPAA
jgi:NTE family protein